MNMISPQSTLEQVVQQQPILSFVLHRFDIQLDNPHKSLELACEEAGIDADFFVELLKVYLDPTSFDAMTFKAFEIPVIIDYLRKTHTFFLSKRLPEIELVFSNLLKHFDDENPFLIFMMRFYANYRTSLIKHIDEEEHYLFPLSLQLHAWQDDPKVNCIYYSLKKFTEVHTDHLETALKEVKNSARNHLPEMDNFTLYQVLFTQLDSFEADLHIHHLIEDEVLVPMVMKIENELRAATLIN